ncbi:MAG: DUF1294 domain-containing protein [Eubacteriales bacterium]|nr:DUF1294 domain-containing protein [Eubacteriales bacterium]
MPWYFEWFILYLALVSVISICVTVYDKIAAKKNIWRVSEKALLTISALGGSVSMFTTMLVIRHKTRHIKFMLGIPLIMLCQIIICVSAFFLTRFV